MFARTLAAGTNVLVRRGAAAWRIQLGRPYKGGWPNYDDGPRRHKRPSAYMMARVTRRTRSTSRFCCGGGGPRAHAPQPYGTFRFIMLWAAACVPLDGTSAAARGDQRPVRARATCAQRRLRVDFAPAKNGPLIGPRRRRHAVSSRSSQKIELPLAGLNWRTFN